jgi:transcriptional regulator with XRE-family HTH domain
LASRAEDHDGDHDTTPEAAFGSELRHLREDHEVSIREVARRLGRTHSQLSVLERGKPLAPEWMVRAYATQFGQNIDVWLAKRRLAVTRRHELDRALEQRMQGIWPSPVCLEPAVVAVRARVGASSPARLMRARSGVIPYCARYDLRARLRRWVDDDDAFATCIIGGRAGSGKTRLGVELCEHANGRGWRETGFLPTRVEWSALQPLRDVTGGRLVVVDYAENRIEQLEQILPLLTSSAAAGSRVRLVLLVRSAPPFGTDWRVVLSDRSIVLDPVLDDAEQHILDDLPLEPGQRKELFDAAATAVAERTGVSAAARSWALARVREELAGNRFAHPLMVIIAAFRVVYGGNEQVSFSTVELLEGLMRHEQRYWRAQAASEELDGSDVLFRRAVALATLTGAGSEREAVDLLRLVPDLKTGPSSELHRLARWVHTLYPNGPDWWNPLEPDLLGEHLVATTYSGASEDRAVISAAFDQASDRCIARMLDVCERIATADADVRPGLQAVLSQRLVRLVDRAVRQARDGALREPGSSTIANALSNALTEIGAEREALRTALDRLPAYPDDALDDLAETLSSLLMESDDR